MATDFKTVDDLKDAEQMKAAIKKLRRSRKPSPFLFKAKCAALDGDPALVLARPGRPINRDLMKAIRVGTLNIKGTVCRDGQDLVFTTTTKVNEQRMVRLISNIGAACKARIPRRRIRIVIPGTEAPTDPQTEQTVEAPETGTTQTAPLSPQKPEKKARKKKRRAPPPRVIKEWRGEATVLRKEESESQKAVDTAQSTLETVQRRRAGISSLTSTEDLIEAVEDVIGGRLNSRDPEHRALQRRIERSRNITEARELAAEWLEEQEDDAKWELEAAEEDLEEAHTARLEMEAQIEASQRAMREAALEAAREKRLAMEKQEEEAEKALHQAREAFLEALLALESRHTDFAEAGLMLAQAEANLEQIGWIAKADRDRLRAAQQRYEYQATHHGSTEAQDDLHEELDTLQGYVAHLMMASNHNSGRVTTLEAKIKSQRKKVMEMLRLHAREFPDLEHTLHLLERLDEEVAHAEHHLHEVQKGRELTDEEEAEIERQKRLAAAIHEAAVDYKSHRAKRCARDTTLDHEPMQDLRLEHPRLYRKMADLIEEMPELTVLLTELILRIQRLEGEGAGELRLPGQKDGPLTVLWDRMPSGPTAEQFRHQLADWKRHEARLWHLLGNAMAVHH